MSNSVDLTQQRSSIDDWVCCLIALGRTLHDTGLRRGTAGIAWTATVDLIISSFLFLTVCSLLYAVDFVPLPVPHVHASYIFVSSLTILHEHQQRSLTQSRTCLKRCQLFRFRVRLYEVDLGGTGAGAIRPWLSALAMFFVNTQEALRMNISRQMGSNSKFRSRAIGCSCIGFGRLGGVHVSFLI